MLNFSYLLLSTVFSQSESKRKALLEALKTFFLSVLAVFLYVSNNPRENEAKKKAHTHKQAKY